VNVGSDVLSIKQADNIPWKAIGKINLLNVGQEDVHGIQAAGVNAQGHSQCHGGESGNENGGGTHYDCLGDSWFVWFWDEIDFVVEDADLIRSNWVSRITE
jgi:hypothetical protein